MKIYVSNYLSKSISVINYETLELEKDIFLGDDIYPHHFCIDVDKKITYIPSSSDGILYVLDNEQNKIIDTISIGGNLSQISLCSDEIFISNEDSNSIYVLDKNSLLPIGVISVDNMPHGFTFDKNINKLYVPCIDSIICIDVLSKSIETKVNTEFKSWHVKLDENKGDIYTTTLDGKIVILENATLAVKEIIDEFLLPVEIVFAYNSKKIYISDLGYRSIKVLDYDTHNQVKEISISGTPQGLAISKNEKYLFVSDTGENYIKVYSTDTYELIKCIKVGKEPTTIVCV